ncbi:uncharacterized protein N7511_009527 [Penicillium nucicola]|uniref:uncharacterized protein n=1 Tax=Penicillium nucicola TaxID=1850975 RepID=UPI002545229D|nr:uncharacterized protein N7511_009527 [Penicillium nucicola]KAJ5747831.1 hypothetical protein N7511_009527 [Penicillium nucicola]
MPALPSFASGLANTLVQRATLASPPNATGIEPVLEVVCAWPVSGQYGPGTRVLYYALIAACVVARKVEFIRSACLAAVLLFPAVAALHGIVLAVLHIDGAVDMDVYGAFQLCAIGILTAPATVRLSTTYFNNPGRNLIFIWTVLLLAGLLSLIVEFMRLKSVVCPINDQGGIEWARTNKFPYGESCGMRCTPDDGPISRLRQGSADNIYVVPTPFELTFNTTTLLAAGCCVPAILQLVSMWIKIMDSNWEKFSPGEKRKPEDTIDGTNGATLSHMTGITEKIRSWLALIEIPVFAAAVLFIIVKGELNFWSKPVYYQTEQIASIGQWAPIVGTGLAVFGSLYLLISADIDAEENDDPNTPFETQSQSQPQPQHPQMIITTTTCAKCQSCALSSDTETNDSRRNSRTTEPQPPDTDPSTSPPNRTSTVQTTQTAQTDLGNRRKVARFFNALSTAITTKTASQSAKSGFTADERTAYPTTPGENLRNPKLAEDISIYNKYPPSMDGRSRAGSVLSVSRDSDTGEGNSRPVSVALARSRSPARHSSLPGQMQRPSRAVTRPSHSNSEPGAYLGCPPSPGLVISEWQMGLSPVSVTPEGRSRNASLSGRDGDEHGLGGGSLASASTAAAPAVAMSGAQLVPTIHVSSHEGS